MRFPTNRQREEKTEGETETTEYNAHTCSNQVEVQSVYLIVSLVRSFLTTIAICARNFTPTLSVKKSQIFTNFFRRLADRMLGIILE